MHQYEIHNTTWGGRGSTADGQQQVFFFLSPFKSTKQEEGNVPTSTLTGYQLGFFPFSPLGGRDASHFLCLSLPPSVRPSVRREESLVEVGVSLASESEEEDEDHNQDGEQHADGAPLSAT